MNKYMSPIIVTTRFNASALTVLTSASLPISKEAHAVRTVNRRSVKSLVTMISMMNVS